MYTYLCGSIEVELTVCCVVMMLNQVSLVLSMSSGYDRQLSVVHDLGVKESPVLFTAKNFSVVEELVTSANNATMTLLPPCSGSRVLWY